MHSGSPAIPRARSHRHLPTVYTRHRSRCRGRQKKRIPEIKLLGGQTGKGSKGGKNREPGVG